MSEPSMGLVGFLVGSRMREDEAKSCQSELEAGRSIVTVHQEANRAKLLKFSDEAAVTISTVKKALRVSSLNSPRKRAGGEPGGIIASSWQMAIAAKIGG
jgi:hypothetical protein